MCYYILLTCYFYENVTAEWFYRIALKPTAQNGKKYLRLKKNTTACYDSKFSLYRNSKDGKLKKLRYKESLVI